MHSDHDQRVERLFHEAVELTASQRGAFLDAHCDDPAVRREVETLLAHEPAVPADFLKESPSAASDSKGSESPQPATSLPSGATVDDVLPGHAGRYRIVAKLGEGGFGVVYEADQEAPLRRRVALKILKAGMDTKQVIARFEAERQALAMMDHPNIARVLDAGATESGRPYFVMELVRGEPITSYCDREMLSIRRRLELFRDVCHAVEHAHQKGIIHRDLKPANILVATRDSVGLRTEDSGLGKDRPGASPISVLSPQSSALPSAQPKVLDFGIAKATEGRLTEATLFTELHQLIGTPQYMSPEQAEVSGADIDTRSDIYSLGVLLYELLAGSTPLEGRRLRSASLSEIQRLIREEEPPKPSTRLGAVHSEPEAQARVSVPQEPPGAVQPGASASGSDPIGAVAARRGTDSKSLVRQLRGDLDWIVMKCLEKDRERRYATASALAEDISRYLDCQQVLATPPSTIYRLQKFVRRNRGAVMAGAVVATALLFATGLSLTFALKEAQQRKAAEAARTRAETAEHQAHSRAGELERVVQFQAEQLSGIDPRIMGVQLRADILKKASELAERSKLPADVLQARIAGLEESLAGSDFTGVALRALDANFFLPALAAIENQFADQPLVKARLLQTVASTMYGLGSLEAAGKPQAEALAIRRRILGDGHPETLHSINELGDLLRFQGKLPEAEALYREGLDTCRRALGEDHPGTLEAMHDMGLLLRDQGKLAEAEPYLRAAVDRRRRLLGEAHPDTLVSVNKLGGLLYAQGKLAEAEPLLREALEKRRRLLGEDHPETLNSINEMALLLQEQGKLSEAEPLYREALEKERRLLGDDHPDTMTSIENMGFFFQARGDPAQAEPYHREALERSRRILGEEHPDTLTSLNNMGMLLRNQGKLAEAEPLLREALEKRRRLLGDDHPHTLFSISNMANLFQAQGKLAEAEPLFREALETRRRVLGPEHPDTLVSVINLGSLLQEQGSSTEAIRLLAPAEPAIRRAFTGGNVVRLGRFLTSLGRARTAGGMFTEAEANLIEGHTILSTAVGVVDRDRTRIRTGLAELYDAWHGAAPDQGYDAKAEEWRSLPDASGATTEPEHP